jgi:hypothetical protein
MYVGSVETLNRTFFLSFLLSFFFYVDITDFAYLLSVTIIHNNPWAPASLCLFLFCSPDTLLSLPIFTFSFLFIPSTAIFLFD